MSNFKPPSLVGQVPLPPEIHPTVFAPLHSRMRLSEIVSALQLTLTTFGDTSDIELRLTPNMKCSGVGTIDTAGGKIKISSVLVP